MRDYLLHHLLEQSARTYSDNAAVVFKDTSVTYSELEKQSSECALKLVRLGVKKGDRVGIMLTKSIESIVSLFGILKVGAVYVPIDPALPVVRAAYIIRHCGIECLITSNRNLDLLTSGSSDTVTIGTALIVGKKGEFSSHTHLHTECLPFGGEGSGESSGFSSADMADGSPAYILHTSGSTGNPKGVAISHLNALTYVNMAAGLFTISANDRFCNHAPLHFDLSVFDIFVAVKCGATVVLLPELLSTFPATLAEYICKERITVWNSVSSVLTMLVDKGRLEKHCFDSLRIVHFSGDIMPVKYLRVLSSALRNASFYNIYGQTEANSSLYYPVQQIPDTGSWRIPVGKPFPNFDVFALNDDRKIVSREGEEGELYVSGSTVALGYWKNDSMTEEKFVSDPRQNSFRNVVYRTGDLVRIDANGDYVFLGRKDNMVKSRGYRIELEEIEIVLSGHPEIMAAVVIPIPDDLVGNRIAAVIVPTHNHSLATAEVVRYCTPLLPKYMIPEIIEFRDSFPKTSSGKVDRKCLAAETAAPAVIEGITAIELSE